jgi:hypothetical protein
MNMSRFGLSAGVALLLAAPTFAQTAEPPAGSAPPPPASTETPTGQPQNGPMTQAPDAPPAPDKAKDKGWEKPEKADSKDGTPVPQPQ